MKANCLLLTSNIQTNLLLQMNILYQIYVHSSPIYKGIVAIILIMKYL